MKIIIDIPEEDYKHLAYADHFKLRSYIESGTPVSKVVESTRAEIEDLVKQTWYTKDSYQEGYKDGLLKAVEFVDRHITDREVNNE